MSLSARWITAVCATAVIAVGAKQLDADDQGGSAEAAGGPAQGCPTYLVIGVPGTGEAPKGNPEKDSKLEIERMGSTVAAYVKQAATRLPATEAKYLAFPYPADAVGPRYFNSVEAGWSGLQAFIQTRVSECPGLRIGLVGFSQGAQVINEALHSLERTAPGTLDNIRAVLLIADPRTDATARYHVAVTFTGDHVRAPQQGGILEAQTLPRAIQDRATSFCIAGDLVCDAPKKGLAALIEAEFLVIHSDTYKSCCTSTPFVPILGDMLANRLLQTPPLHPPHRSPPGRVHPE